MERDEREELNRVVDHEVRGHFPGLWPGVGCADARGPFCRSECRHGDQVADARQVHPWLPGPPGGVHTLPLAVTLTHPRRIVV